MNKVYLSGQALCIVEQVDSYLWRIGWQGLPRRWLLPFVLCVEVFELNEEDVAGQLATTSRLAGTTTLAHNGRSR